MRPTRLAIVSLYAVACSSATTEPLPGGAPSAAQAERASAGASAAPAASATTPSAAPAEPSRPMDLSTAVGAYLRDSAAAWTSRDPKRHTALYAADGVIGMPGEKGWEEATATQTEAALGAYFASFPDLKLTYTRVLGRDRFAVAEWVFTGTNEGEVMGRPATRKKVGYRGVSLLTFAPDGKLKRESVYFDTTTMLGQLGLGPKGQPVRPVEVAPTGPAEVYFAKERDEAAVTLAKRWLETASRGDAKAVAALATDDIVVSNQYMPTDTKGKKALEKELAEGAKAFVDQKIDLKICVPAASWVACEYTWTATWKGPAMGRKPTGKTGTIHAVEVFRIEDGKVARATAYASSPEFAAAFGVNEPPKSDLDARK